MQTTMRRFRACGLIQVNPAGGGRGVCRVQARGLTWVMAVAVGGCSAGKQAPTPSAKSDASMAGELQWEGFVSLADSGIREALFAAGVDCAMHGPCEAGYLAASSPEQDEHEPSFP